MYKYLIFVVFGICLAESAHADADFVVTSETALSDTYGNDMTVATPVSDVSMEGIAQQTCDQNYSELVKRVIAYDKEDSYRGTIKLINRLKSACDEKEVDLVVKELKTRTSSEVQDFVLDLYKKIKDDQELQVRLLRVMGSYKGAVKKLFKALDSIHPKVVSFATRALMEQLSELDEDEILMMYNKASNDDKIYIVEILIRKLSPKYIKVYIVACTNGEEKVKEVAVSGFMTKLKSLNGDFVYTVFRAANDKQKIDILNTISKTAWSSNFMPALKLGITDKDSSISKLARTILEKVDPISALDY